MMHDYKYRIKSSFLQTLSVPNQTHKKDNIYEEIRINLETLLNSRLKHPMSTNQYSDLSHSVFRYGLRDFMHIHYGSKIMQDYLRKEIEELVRIFEPRIIDPKVSLENNVTTQTRTLNLKIEGNLNDYGNQKAIFLSSVNLSVNKFSFN